MLPVTKAGTLSADVLIRLVTGRGVPNLDSGDLRRITRITRTFFYINYTVDGNRRHLIRTQGIWIWSFISARGEVRFGAPLVGEGGRVG